MNISESQLCFCLIAAYIREMICNLKDILIEIFYKNMEDPCFMPVVCNNRSAISSVWFIDRNVPNGWAWGQSHA